MTDGPARCEASTRCDSAWRDAMRAAEARSQSTARRRAATDGVWRAGASAGAGMSVGASVTLRAGGREHRVPRARRVTGAARGVARACAGGDMAAAARLVAGCFAACGVRPAGRRRFASSRAWIAGGARRSDCFARVFRACGR
ncbi:PriA [Burkholderia pseudomallei]|nr:PriA [Burkholderia pseudomallei]QBP56050.1 PriA [Burkholderia pseudomallei]